MGKTQSFLKELSSFFNTEERPWSGRVVDDLQDS